MLQVSKYFLLYILQYLSFSHPHQGRIDFNTVHPSLPSEMNFLIHRCRWIDDEENVRTPPKLGRYWKIYPLRHRDFPRPSGLRKYLGNILGIFHCYCLFFCNIVVLKKLTIQIQLQTEREEHIRFAF